MRRRSTAGNVCALAWAWALATCAAVAQAPPGEAPPPREVGPPLRLQRRDDGRLEIVPGLTLEDLEEAWLQQRSAAKKVPMPRVTLESFRAAAKVSGDPALAVELTLGVRTVGPEWARLPLRLGEWIWLAQPTSPTAEAFLERADSGEMICWVKARGDKDRHELRVQALAPVERLLESRRMKLTAPRSAVSEITLSLGDSPDVVRLAAGHAVLNTNDAAGNREAVVRGADGAIEIAWEPPQEMPLAAPVESTAQVRVDVTASAVRFEARLSLRNHAAPLAPIEIALPIGARLLPREASEYRVEALPGESGAAARVRVSPRQESASLDLLLLAERPSLRENEPVDLAGFRVEGAVRQSGHIAIHCDPALATRFGALAACRPSADLPDPLDAPASTAGFEFFAQPFSLPISLAPRTTRVVVEPSYELNVERDQIVCVGRWRYHVEGGKLARIDWQPGDWTISNWGPPERLGEALEPGATGLALAEPASGAFEIVWRAVLPTPSDQSTLEFRFPQPVTGQVLTCDIQITSDENCVVLPADETSATWSLREGAAATSSPTWRVERVDASQPLALRRVVHPGELRAEGAARVAIGPRSVVIDQRLRVVALYERRSAITLRLPRALLAAGVPEVTLGDVRLPLAVDRQTGGGSTCDAWALLPEPSMGVIELNLRSLLPRTTPSANRLDCPLATVADAHWTAQRLAIEPPEGCRIAAAPPTPWQSVDRNLWEIRERTDGVSIEWAPDDHPDSRIDRAYVQTRWSSGQQHLRAAYRVLGPRSGLVLVLPPGSRGITAWVDGRAVTPEKREGDRWAVRWTAVPAPGKHVVEVSCSFPDAEPWARALAPRLEPGAIVERLYWRLPDSAPLRLRHAPEGMHDESAWTWTQWGFERVSRFDAGALERWAGARSEPELDGADPGFLFSANGYVDAIEPRCVSRAAHILAASGVTLSVGLVWLFFANWRRGIVWASVACIALGLVLFPVATLEMLQAGVLGLGLVGVAALLHRRQARRPLPLPAPRSSSVVRPDSSTRIRTAPPIGDVVAEPVEPSSESRR